MMKEKKLLPKRRFTAFHGEWKLVSLSDVADIIGGGTPSTSIKEYWNGKIDWYSPTEIGTQVYANKSEKKITELGLQKSSATILPANRTILFTSRAGIGDMAILNKDGATNQGFQSLVLKDGIDIYFIYSMGYKIKDYALTKASGSTFLEISGKELRKMKFFLPTSNEQQKIGEFFRVLDERIANQERKIAKVKALKSSYLTEMFPQEGETVPKRRFKEFDGKWKGIKLGAIGSTFSGLSGKTKKDFGHGTAEFVTYMNVFNNSISNLRITEKVIRDDKQTQLKYGDILFTTSSETPNEVGMSSVWLDNRPNVYLNSFCFGLRPSTDIDYYFVAYLLRANLFRKQMEVLAQGISRYNISKNRVMEVKVDLPSIKEQQKIGQFFKNLDNQIETEEKKLNKLKETKEAYLEEMFV